MKKSVPTCYTKRGSREGGIGTMGSATYGYNVNGSVRSIYTKSPGGRCWSHRRVAVSLRRL